MVSIRIIGINPGDHLYHHKEKFLGTTGMFNIKYHHGNGWYKGQFFPDIPIQFEEKIYNKHNCIMFLAIKYEDFIGNTLHVSW